MRLILLVSEALSQEKVRTRTVEVEGERIFIGREGTTVMLTDPRCSRQHAILFEDAHGHLWMKDLGSTNGTYLDQSKVDTYQLHEGECFRIGRTEIEVARFIASREMPEGQTPDIEPEEVEISEEGTTMANARESLVVSWPEAITCLPKEKQRELENFLSPPSRMPQKKR